MGTFHIIEGDALAVLRTLPSESVHCCVTSPPYWGLRDYGVAGQMGNEPTPEAFVAGMVAVFAEVRRVLRADGTCWVNLGDSYSAHPGQRKETDAAGAKQQTKRGSTSCPSQSVAGLKPKDLVGIPWRVAFALQADGWYLRSDIIWHKPNPMPESVTDRPTKSHEYLFLLSKSERYLYDSAAIAEDAVSTELKKFTDGGQDKQRGHGRRHAGFNGRYADRLELEGIPKTRNRRDVWTIATHAYPEAHFATFPPALVEPCILAGCPVGGIVLDPFTGSGTAGMVALRHGREFVGFELNPTYAAMARDRITNDAPMFNTVAGESYLNTAERDGEQDTLLSGMQSEPVEA